MATTSLWRVTSKKNAAIHQLVDYVTNEKKTIERFPDTNNGVKSIESLIDYAMREDATSDPMRGRVDKEDDVLVNRFVSGVNCDPDNAVKEFQIVKEHYGKTDGTLAYHGYQSFAPGEATPEIAHEIGVKLANEIWGEGYQVVVCTHLDKSSHLHNHFVVNSVGFLDGKKYFRSESDYRAFRDTSDRLCREYGLSTIEKRQGKRKDRTEWEAEKSGDPTWKDIIRSDVDIAISKVDSYKDLLTELRRMEYEIKDGKYLSVRPKGRERFFRLERQLGEEYSKDYIQNRLRSKQYSPQHSPEDESTQDDVPPMDITPSVDDANSDDTHAHEEVDERLPPLVIPIDSTNQRADADTDSPSHQVLPEESKLIPYSPMQRSFFTGGYSERRPSITHGTPSAYRPARNQYHRPLSNNRKSFVRLRLVRSLYKSRFRQRNIILLVVRLPLIKPKRSVTGVKALYLRYMYLLGKLPRGKTPRNLPRTKMDYESFLRIKYFKRKMDLLLRCHINTDDDLRSYLRVRQADYSGALSARSEIMKQYRGSLSDEQYQERNQKLRALGLSDIKRDCRMLEDMLSQDYQRKETVEPSKTESNSKNKKEKEIRK